MLTRRVQLRVYCLQIVLLLVSFSLCIKGFVPKFNLFQHQQNYRYIGRPSALACSQERDVAYNEDEINHLVSSNGDADYRPGGANQAICTRRTMITQSTAAATAFVLLITAEETGISHAATAIAIPNNNNNDAATTTIRNATELELELEPIDVSKVLQENAINITLKDKQNKSQAFINRTSYEKVIQPTMKPQRPSLIPTKISFFKNKGPAEIIEPIPDTKLLLASAVGGSVTEIVRSVVLYPLTTIKTRVQYKMPSISSFKRMLKGLRVKDETQLQDDIANKDDVQIKNEQGNQTNRNNIISKPTENDNHGSIKRDNTAIKISLKKITNLYAGFVPFLIASVPAAGIYFGIRDVSKRQLSTLNNGIGARAVVDNTIFTPQLDDLSLTLLSVFLADICCLAVKTPALAISVRRQVATIEEFTEIANTTVDGTVTQPIVNEKNYFILQNNADKYTKSYNETYYPTSSSSNAKSSLLLPWWKDVFKDSWKQLPVVVLTDIPYLFMKISLLRVFSTGSESIAEYTLLNVLMSCLAAAITTPFDVARTRILVDNNDDPADGVSVGLIAKDRDGYIQSGSLKYIYETLNMIAKEGTGNQGGAYSTLFAGWYERVLYLGISIAWFDSIRTIGYLAIRDILLLR